MDKTTVYESLGFVLAFLGIGIAYYAVHFGIRLEKLKRELTHKERMRALELGRSLPGDRPGPRLLRGGLIATAVPICVCGLAWLTSESVGYTKGVWERASIVSIFALVCGSVVAVIAPARQSKLEQDALTSACKPQTEEDAYHVVSTRG